MSKVQTSLRLDEDKLFEVKIPTTEFKNSIKELKTKDGKSFHSVDELFKDLDS